MNRLSVAILLASTACANTSYLARVNGDRITRGDLRREFGLRHAAMEKYLADEQDVRKYLDSAIERRLLVQEAERIGLQELPEVREVLADDHASLMVRLLLKREIDEKQAATDAEIQAAYDMGAERLKVREVAVATREEAEKIRSRVLAGDDMEELAKELSLGSTAKGGGLLMVTWGLDEAWETHVLPLEKGAVSAVFASKGRWEVVRVEDRLKNERPPLEEAKARVRGRIEQRKRLARESAFLAEMRAKYTPRKLECDLSVESLKKALESKDARPCATWSGGALTLHDIASRLNLDALAAEPAERYPESIAGATDDLLAQAYLLAEATARGYASAPQVALEEATRRERLLSSMLLEKYVLADAMPTDDEVRQHIAAHPEQQVVPEMRSVNRFAVRTQAEADEVRRKLADGEEFQRVQAKTAVVPGSSGKVTVKKGDPSPEAAPVFAARKGEVVGPVETKGVFFFVEVLGITPERQADSDEAVAPAPQLLLRERGEKAYKEWTGKLRAAAKIEINEAGIKAYLKDTPVPKDLMPKPVQSTHGINEPAAAAAPEPSSTPLPRAVPPGPTPTATSSTTPAAPAASPRK